MDDWMERDYQTPKGLWLLQAILYWSIGGLLLIIMAIYIGGIDYLIEKLILVAYVLIIACIVITPFLLYIFVIEPVYNEIKIDKDKLLLRNKRGKIKEITKASIRKIVHIKEDKTTKGAYRVEQEDLGGLLLGSEIGKKVHDWFYQEDETK